MAKRKPPVSKARRGPQQMEERPKKGRRKSRAQKIKPESLPAEESTFAPTAENPPSSDAPASDPDRVVERTLRDDIGLGNDEKVHKESPEVEIPGAHLKLSPTQIRGGGMDTQARGTLEAEGAVVTSPDRATLKAINDSPTAEDDIGFTPYVHTLARMMLHNETSMPLTVGIFGPWGTGKTSFMRQVKEEVTRLLTTQQINTTKILQVEFDAWKHQVNETLWAALLQTITAEIENRQTTGQLLLGRVRNAFSELDRIQVAFYGMVLVVLPLALLLFAPALWKVSAALPFLSLLANKPRDLLTGLFSRLFAPLGLSVREIVQGRSFPNRVQSAQSFTRDFDNIIQNAVSEEGRLIVYIDDLDRCSPQHVVGVIDALNTFLDSDRCVFLLGMDRRKVAESIGVAYGQAFKTEDPNGPEKGEKLRRYGEDFLEKIIQLPLTLPVMDRSGVRQLAERHLSTYMEKKSGGEEENSTETKVPQDRSFLEVTLTDELKGDLQEIVQFVDPRTPRRIKRFLNRVWFFYLLYHVAREDFRDLNVRYLPLWMLFVERFPETARAVGENAHSLTWGDILTGKWEDMVRDRKDVSQPMARLFQNIQEVHVRTSGQIPWYEKYREAGAIEPYSRLTRCVEP
jgi:hypothetical protein